MSVGIDINVRTGFADVPDGVSVSASATCSVTLESSVTLLLNAADTEANGTPFDEELGEIDLGEIPLPFAIPTVVVPKVPVYLDLEGSVSVGVEASVTVGAGVSWTSTHPGSLSVRNLSGKPRVGGGPVKGLTASGSAFFGLEAEPTLAVDDAGGPSIDADLGMQAKVNPDPGPGEYFFELGPALLLKAGFSASLFGYNPQLVFQFAQFTYPGFIIDKPPAPSYTLSPADPAVAPGKSVTFTPTRSIGTGSGVIWRLIGATPGDKITSGGTLTVAAPAGRTLTVEVKDGEGAFGETEVTVGTPFDGPSGLSYSQVNGHPFSVDLSWSPPAQTGGYAVTGYRVVTEPATVTSAVTGTSTDLTGLKFGSYAIEVFAINKEGLVSPPAGVSVGFLPSGGLNLSPAVWTASEVQLPADATAQPEASMSAISCGDGGLCVAIGGYKSTKGSVGVLEALVDGIASTSEAPLPANADRSSRSVELSAVACSGNECVVVGDYLDTNDNDEGLIDTLSGGRWSSAEAPLPSNAGDPGGNSYGDLDSVACPAAGTCLAVGTYDDDEARLGLNETLSGRVWTPSEAMLTSGDPNPDVTLSSVTCPAAGSCVEVGSYDNDSGQQEGLLGELSAGAWTLTEAPLPSNANDEGQQAGDLVSVSCGAVGSCVAVGDYQDQSLTRNDVIETLSDGSWTDIEAPVPPDGGGPEPFATLLQVACGAAGSCAAVGTYDNNDGEVQGYIDTLAGTKWTATEVGAEAEYGPGPEPNSVSCPTAGDCVAVGGDGEPFNVGTQVFAETLSGRTWATAVLPLPSGDDSNGPSPYLNAVSCMAPDLCAAAGAYPDSSDDYQGLIDQQQ